MHEPKATLDAGADANEPAELIRESSDDAVQGFNETEQRAELEAIEEHDGADVDEEHGSDEQEEVFGDPPARRAASSPLTRVLVAAVVVLGAGGVGYAASRMWPMPGVASSTPAPVTHSRRVPPTLVMPAEPAQAARPSKPVASPAGIPAEAARLRPTSQPHTTAALPDRSDNAPSPSPSVGADEPTKEQATSVPTKGEATSVRPTDQHESEPEPAAAPRRANHRRSQRVARDPTNVKSASQLADTAPAGAGSRQDPALKQFMATPNNY
jgi:hypothetical protein